MRDINESLEMLGKISNCGESSIKLWQLVQADLWHNASSLINWSSSSGQQYGNT